MRPRESYDPKTYCQVSFRSRKLSLPVDRYNSNAEKMNFNRSDGFLDTSSLQNSQKLMIKNSKIGIFAKSSSERD